MNITKVISEKDRKDFIDIGCSIYKDDKNWIRPLDKDINSEIKINNINFEYSYLVIVKQPIINAKYVDIKNSLKKEYNRIK